MILEKTNENKPVYYFLQLLLNIKYLWEKPINWVWK
jgi:hypothetical protein